MHAHYQDRHEEYVPVAIDDLREIRALGPLQQSLFGVGTFFFSSPVWLLVSLIANQPKFAFTAWMGMYFLSIVFGVILAGIGIILYVLRERRLNKYFPQKQLKI